MQTLKCVDINANLEMHRIHAAYFETHQKHRRVLQNASCNLKRIAKVSK